MSDLSQRRGEIGDDLDPRTRFVLQLGLALHESGVTAFRLEGALSKVADTLGLHGSFFSTPTALMASLDGRTHLLRATAGDVNLGRLCALDEVGNRVIAGELDPDDGARAIDEILARPAPFGAAIIVTAFTVASAVAAIFLSGGFIDAGVSGVSGLLIGALTVVVRKKEEASRLFLVLASLLSAGLAWSAAAAGLPVDVLVCTIAGLIAFVPGLSLTVAMSELANGHLASGTARLAYVGIVLVQMGLGVALAARLGGAMGIDAPEATSAVATHGAWLIFATLPLSVLAFIVLLQARLRDAGWLILAGAAALAVTVAVNALAHDPVLASFSGALVAAVLSNGLARWLDRPATNFLVPSMFLLVPGSVGLRSVSRLLEADVLGGVHTAFEMSLIAVALVAGILVANLVLSARRHL